MIPPVRPPRLRYTLFPLIYPPHLLVLPATFGLHLLQQTYPHFRALYVIPVRRTKGLPTASFRFHLAMDTLAVQLYTSSLPRRVRDFHPLERAHGAQTAKKHPGFLPDVLLSLFGVFFVVLNHFRLSYIKLHIRFYFNYRHCFKRLLSIHIFFYIIICNFFAICIKQFVYIIIFFWKRVS